MGRIYVLVLSVFGRIVSCKVFENKLRFFWRVNMEFRVWWYLYGRLIIILKGFVFDGRCWV